MQSIKSDLLFVKKLKTNVFDNKYSEIQNIIDILNISNDLYYFLSNPFLNFKKKHFFFKNLNFIQFFTSKTKSSIITSFMNLCKKKKKWIQINIITAIPLKYSIEESLLKLFKKSYKTIKFFIEKKVNNNIIGGLILRFEDKEFNSNLEETIRKLKIHLKNYI